MTTRGLQRYVARAVIEFTTPFHVGTGREGEVADAAVVADANGLPAIPGSSIAGALRDAVGRQLPPAGEDQSLNVNRPRENRRVSELFGYQGRRPVDSDAPAPGQGSKLSVSWACIHDSKGNPVEGIVEPQRFNDAVLKNALAPTVRDHVRLGYRGATEDRAKFDELAVCTGHRFTFELELAGDGADAPIWNELLAILRGGVLRLGGRSRRGFGAFTVKSLLAREFDLNKPEHLKQFFAHPVELGADRQMLAANGFKELIESSAVEKENLPNIKLCVTLPLQPGGYWMFGAGEDDLGADMAPVRDSRISWDSDGGKVLEDCFVIPGSAVKGAISHRVAFHFNRLEGHWADNRSKADLVGLTGVSNGAVRQLFGYVSTTGESKDEQGVRGRVLIDDLIYPAERFDGAQQLVHHVALDRFTGGARTQTGALFNERPIWKGNWHAVRVTVLEAQSVPQGTIRRAFYETLLDLCESRLQLGGGSGRGLGYCEADAACLEKLKVWAEEKP